MWIPIDSVPAPSLSAIKYLILHSNIYEQEKEVSTQFYHTKALVNKNVSNSICGGGGWDYGRTPTNQWIDYSTQPKYKIKKSQVSYSACVKPRLLGYIGFYTHAHSTRPLILFVHHFLFSYSSILVYYVINLDLFCPFYIFFNAITYHLSFFF